MKYRVVEYKRGITSLYYPQYKRFLTWSNYCKPTKGYGSLPVIFSNLYYVKYFLDDRKIIDSMLMKLKPAKKIYDY